MMEGSKTNNHVEGWHNKINRAAGKAHPNIFELVELPYSGYISREKIFANFADLSLFAKILFANIACARRTL